MINTSPVNFALGSSTPFTAISADTIPTDLVIFNEGNEDITLLPATNHVHTLGNLTQAHFRLSFPTGVIYPLSELAKLSVLRQPDWRVHYTKDESWEHLYFYWVPLIHTHAEPHLLLKGTHSREQNQDAPHALNSLKLNLFHLFCHPSYASPNCPVELHCGGLVHLGDTSLEGSQRSSSMQLLHVKGLNTLPRQFVSENAPPPFMLEDAAPTAQIVSDLMTQTETGWFRDIVTQPALAPILASASSPLTLDLQSDNNSGALYIADEPISMDVVIQNGDKNDVTLSSSTHGETDTQDHLAGAQFALYFFAGVLQDPDNLSQIKVIKSTLGNASDWHITYVQQNAKLNNSDALCDCFYFYWIPTSGETTLTLRGTTSHTDAPNSLSLTLNYLNAAATYQSNATSVQLTYGGKCSNAAHPISGDNQGLLGYYYSRTINLINHTGKAICPLVMSFVDSNTILNDGVTVNSLTLRIANYSTQDDIPLTSQSKFTLVLDSSLASNDEIDKVVVSSVSYAWLSVTKGANKNEWLIEPLDDLQNTGWKAQDGWDFTIANLTTTTDNGHSPVTLYYDHLPGYWDGHLVTTIEKSPIAYRSPASPNSPGSNEPTKAVAVTISPRFSGNAENIGLAIKQGNLQVDENIILGADRKDSRFILNPRPTSAGDAFFLAPDKSDGTWDWPKSFVYRRQDGYVGLGTNDLNSITDGLHLFGNRSIRLEGGHIYLANQGYGLYWGSNYFIGSSNDGTQLGFWDSTNGWNLYVNTSGVTHAGHGINIDSGNLQLEGGSIRLRGGELSSWGPVTLHADDDGTGDANSLVVTKGAIDGSITTVFTVDNSGDLSTHGGSLYLNGGGIDTQNGEITAWGGIQTGNISTTATLALAANGPITLSCDTDSTGDNPAFVINRAKHDVLKIWNDNHVAIDGYLTVTGSISGAGLIDGLRISIFSDSQSGGDLGGGWHRLPQDLNYKAGGKYIYLEYHIS